MNAAEFRSALRQIGISQAEFARLIKRSPNTVTAWINAGSIPAAGRLFCRVALDHGLDYARKAIAP